MISLIGFLLFLGLIVFGPEKTIELAQETGRLLGDLKSAAGQLHQSALIPSIAPTGEVDRREPDGRSESHPA
jgi:Sec-independent protein translocase protein TatA